MSTFEKFARLSITTFFTCVLILIVLLLTKGMQWMVIHTYSRPGFHDTFFRRAWLFNTYVFMTAQLLRSGCDFVDGFRRSGI